ncbi:MAG TPA: sterol desaturase family protein [Ferruginibacter sp.]|nr:sterol desaturase family protein [Ferruginibacter sp.]HMP20740.1 sterol desaturase family protein [Ferruginibacter sp.]
MPLQLNENTLIAISTPLYIAVIGAEILFSHFQFKKFYSVKETLTNVYLCALNGGIDMLFRSVYLFIILEWFYSFHIFDFGQHAIAYWLLLFIAEDLAFYVEHRVDHYCRLFWAVHVTHHSSEEFNLTTGFRSSVFQPLYRFVYFIPLALIGFRPADIVFMYSITQVYGILVHTQYIKSMPAWFEAVFVSPSHHRVHHGSNIIYLDKNMGMCLIIWDKLFGTFQQELPEEPLRYGLTKPLEQPHHPVKVIFHEWESIGRDLKKSRSLWVKLKYLFMPPGWSHDGSSKTAKELRHEIAAASNSAVADYHAGNEVISFSELSPQKNP